MLDLESRTNSLKKPKEQTDAGAVTHCAPKRLTSSRTPVTQHDHVNVTAHEGLEVTLNVKLPDGCKLNEDAPSKWQVCWVETAQGTGTPQLTILFQPLSLELTYKDNSNLFL